jgi:hypothetical protein
MFRAKRPILAGGLAVFLRDIRSPPILSFMAFAGGALENFWQKCARFYEERRSSRMVDAEPERRSKPQRTAKIFSAGSESQKAKL